MSVLEKKERKVKAYQKFEIIFNNSGTSIIEVAVLNKPI